MQGARWFWPGGIAGLGLAFAVIPLLRGRLFFYWDNATQHYPTLAFLSHWLDRGVIPTWWPEVMAGFPVAAEGQGAYFHPIHLAIAWVLPVPVAFMIEFGIAFAVSGLGTYFFLRLFRVARPVSAFGAIIYMFSSLALACVRNAALVRSVCLLSLAMFLAERFARDRRPRDGAWLALVIGLQLLSGYPTPALVTLVAAVVHVALRSWQLERTPEPRPRMKRAAAAVAGVLCAAGLAAAVAAIQLVPTARHVPESIRLGGLDPDAASRFSSNPKHWLQWVVPYAVHPLRPVTDADEATVRAFSWFYMGALAPLTVFAAFWWPRRGTHVAWAIAPAVCLAALLAVGDRTPVLPLLLKLPVIDSLRYPSRLVPWASFGCAVIAAFGLRHLMAYRRRRRPLPQTFLFSWGGVLAVAATLAWLGGTPARAIGVSMAFATLAVAAALLCLRASAACRHLVIAVVFATVGADLLFFRVVVNYARTVPTASALTPEPIAEWLSSQGEDFRVLQFRTKPPQMLTRDQESPAFLTAPSGWLVGTEGLRPNFSLPFPRPLILGDAIESWLRDHPERLGELTGLLSALNVKYVLGFQNVSPKGWPPAMTAGGVTAWQNPQFLPRAFLVGEVAFDRPLDPRDTDTVRARSKALLANLGQPDLFLDDVSIIERYLRAPVDFATTAILETSELPKLGGRGQISRVTPNETPPGRLAFDVETDRDSLLYVSRVSGSGWTATVDGQPAQVYRANWIGTGVVIPAGATRVELAYELPGLRIGAMISAAGAAIVLVLLVASRPSPRRAAPSSRRRQSRFR